MRVSVVIIVKNGAATLGRCLDSISSFDDIVVYNNGSSDDTASIASSYANVRLIEGDFFGFGSTKNMATNFYKYIKFYEMNLEQESTQSAQIKIGSTQLCYSSNKIFTQRMPSEACSY